MRRACLMLTIPVLVWSLPLLSAPDRSEQTKAVEETIRRLDKVIAENPKSDRAYQARGVAHFKLGHAKEAVADFDKYLELDPAARPHHWQRGIALYYAGRYDDGAKQFEIHRTVNPEDVENAAWHFLCVAKAATERGERDAAEKARKVLIPIKADTRVPMMQIHALFAGKATAEDVIAAANAGNVGADERKERLFYAHLYLGIYYEAIGQDDLAKKHILISADDYATEGYMDDVARVHAMKFRPAATQPSTTRK